MGSIKNKKDFIQMASSDNNSDDEEEPTNLEFDDVRVEDNNNVDQETKPTSDENGKFKYGIIYLSYIPDGLNVKLLYEIMSDFGEVGRIYLEPERNKKKHRTYTEGWIEFKKKRVAKAVAKRLNGTPLQIGRKHCKMNGQIWSIKYLHRFKWTHLTEQLAHDRAVQNQKRKFEMTQTKKQVDFYQKMTEQSKRMKKQKLSNTDENVTKRAQYIESKQNKPSNRGNELQIPVDETLLNSIFKRVA